MARKLSTPVPTPPSPDGSVARALGGRLARARAGASLTQQALANAVGCTVGYVSMAEHGQRLPRLPVLATWAAACGTTLSRLMDGLEDEVLAVHRGGQ